MTQTAAQRKAAERGRHKDAGRVAVTVHIYPDDREKLAHYIKRLNDRAERRRSANAANSAATGRTAARRWKAACGSLGPGLWRHIASDKIAKPGQCANTSGPLTNQH